MTHKELRTMLKQLSEYQLKHAMRFLALNQELAEIEPGTCPCCGDHNAAFIRKGIQGRKAHGILGRCAGRHPFLGVSGFYR